MVLLAHVRQATRQTYLTQELQLASHNSLSIRALEKCPNGSCSRVTENSAKTSTAVQGCFPRTVYGGQLPEIIDSKC
jgi:hypothetical protein